MFLIRCLQTRSRRSRLVFGARLILRILFSDVAEARALAVLGVSLVGHSLVWSCNLFSCRGT